ncbi:MAG: 5-oxoprolinase subunit PxpB [Chloroflexi bacterium]|nr:5-oxoprolinase subunit PxpB [Chloroflexota bacterium]
MRSFGESALLVEVGSAGSAQLLAAALRSDPPAALVEAVPGLGSVLVELDPMHPAASELAAVLEERINGLGTELPAGRRHEIPVVYEGPDLDEVARLTGRSVDEVVALHTSAELRVLFCGFAPGFAYLGDLPDELRVERLATPRTSTPAGSVAIAGSMSGVYPSDLPGGWRVIGHTDVAMFDPQTDPPTLLVPGDVVRFTRA